MSAVYHTTPTIPAKHGAIWFPDGDILLSTRSIDPSSQGSEVRYIQTLFRVHKSILASHSTIFHDAFTSANDKLNITTVHLLDDTSNLEIFLGLMYGKDWFSPYGLHLSNVALTLRSSIDLAAKYNAKCVMKYASNMIKPHWPKTLEQWDIWENCILTQKGPLIRCDDPWLDDLLPEPISTMLIARCQPEFSSILRATLYLLYLTPVSNDREERHAYRTSLHRYPGACYQLSAHWWLLEGSEVMKVFKAKEEISKLATRYAALLFQPFLVKGGHPNDATHDCKLACLEMRKSYMDEVAVSRNVLRVLKKVGDRMYLENNDFCEECAVHVEEKLRDLRNKIWDELPRYYGIENVQA